MTLDLDSRELQFLERFRQKNQIRAEQKSIRASVRAEQIRQRNESIKEEFNSLKKSTPLKGILQRLGDKYNLGQTTIRNIVYEKAT